MSIRLLASNVETSTSAVLALGEVGVDTDTGLLRIGDGTTAWSDLTPVSPAGGGVSDVAYDATTWDGVTDVAPSKNALRDKFESLSGASGLSTTTINYNTAHVDDATGITLIASPQVGDRYLFASYLVAGWNGDGLNAISDAKLQIGTALAVDHLLCAHIGSGFADGSPLENDIAALAASGDLKTPSSTVSPHGLGGEKSWNMYCEVVNAVPIKAWVTDVSGDPVGTSETDTGTLVQGEVAVVVIPLQ